MIQRKIEESVATLQTALRLVDDFRDIMEETGRVDYSVFDEINAKIVTVNKFLNSLTPTAVERLKRSVAAARAECSRILEALDATP